MLFETFTDESYGHIKMETVHSMSMDKESPGANDKNMPTY